MGCRNILFRGFQNGGLLPSSVFKHLIFSNSANMHHHAKFHHVCQMIAETSRFFDFQDGRRHHI